MTAFRALGVVLAFLVSGVVCQAQDYMRAVTNVQQEMTDCIAFYVVSRQCIGEKRDKETYDRTGKVIERLTELSHSTGKTINMTDDAMLSRIKLSIDDQMNLINRDCVNFSSLLSRHGRRCKFVTERPIDLLNEYLAKKQ